MSIIDIGAIAIALGLDAFGVALSLGFDKRMKRNRKILFIIFASFFQFLFVFLGGIGGELFNRYIYTLPNIVGGIIIIFVGILMIKEGLAEEDKIEKIHWVLIAVLGISVSIDALVIGFSTFNIFYDKFILFKNSAIVGIVTSILTFFAFIISKYIRKINFIRKYADLLGGIILILFGIKMILF
ncbi:manganese efflux pump MntP family protein [Caldisalinibacter kiritimatiensis]|uniref:Integral membrane protein n=1 Tax=Caldisalinibacter kiritimatiensis TaxID=1304284 RepID=R1CQV6_9FIRM|nr:manganese efflux pump [Caldisalinibacter kiritimatiensis]EOD01041.1 Integral membrane protein [Caldisalinibacter kiritimatiensis]